MKNALNIIVSVSVLALCGCSTTGNTGLSKELAAFLQSIPANQVTDASLNVTTPLWGHSVSVTGMGKTADGTVTITNLKDNFTIPLWGTSKTFSLSGLTLAAGTAPLATPPSTPSK